MKKLNLFVSILLLTIFIIIAFSTTINAASSGNANSNIKFEVVEENICKIDLTDYSHFEKKLINKDLDKKQVTLQLKVTNDAAEIKPTGELMLVLDNSESMTHELSDGKSRYESIVSSANTLIENLLKDNDNLKIGVVSFSSNSDITKEGTSEDAKLVTDLETDSNKLKNSLANIKFEGSRTNLDAGITLAKQYYSEEKNNKYMIILTDGVPNIAIGNSNVFYDTAIDKNAEVFSSLSTSNISVITMLTDTGELENTYPGGEPGGVKIYPSTDLSYGQIIEKVFGSPEKPKLGKFYYIQDEDIEKTITQDIYNALKPQSQTINNIKIIDYFPKEIIDNFDFAYVSSPNIGKISTEVDKTNNSITWTIDELKSHETATVQYTLTLKDNFDSSIINKILDTNEKVDITFDDENGKQQSKTSDVTPKVKITEQKAPVTKTPDNTTSPKILPRTGSQILIFALLIIGTISLILGLRLNYINKNSK